MLHQLDQILFRYILSIGIVGNPGLSYQVLPPLEVDYSDLPQELPQILGYESKWHPESAYWKRITYKRADLPEAELRTLIDHATKLFSRLECRDYARFDFRADSFGLIKLLEVNPNPGWCWDGKLNLMADWGNMDYTELFEKILEATRERLHL